MSETNEIVKINDNDKKIITAFSDLMLLRLKAGLVYKYGISSVDGAISEDEEKEFKDIANRFENKCEYVYNVLTLKKSLCKSEEKIKKIQELEEIAFDISRVKQELLEKGSDFILNFEPLQENKDLKKELDIGTGKKVLCGFLYVFLFFPGYFLHQYFSKKKAKELLEENFLKNNTNYFKRLATVCQTYINRSKDWRNENIIQNSTLVFNQSEEGKIKKIKELHEQYENTTGKQINRRVELNLENFIRYANKHKSNTPAF